MYRYMLTVSLLVCIQLAGLNGQFPKLPVTVLYESLCPDSIRFITNELNPNFPALKDFIDLKLVPFGKSDSFNNGESFQCQHGPDECVGNMVQSCVLHKLNEPQDQVDFVACQMNFGAESTGQQCSESVGVPWNHVEYCMQGGLGRQLQLEAEKVTKIITPSFVPTILYNHQFNQQLQDRSLSNFVGVVCELIENIAPVCNTAGLRANSRIIYA